MTSRKKIRRARRHTLGLLAEAEDALLDGEGALAHKLVLRALEAGFMNARVHADAAVLLGDLGKKDAARETARRARELAPTADFVRACWRELGMAWAEEPASASGPANDGAAASAPSPTAPHNVSSARAAAAVAAVAEGLRQRGAALQHGWLGAAECEELRAAPASAAMWSAQRALATARGSLEWRSVRAGVVAWLELALGELFAVASTCANELRAEVGNAGRYPGAPPPPRAHVERAVVVTARDGALWSERRDPGDRGTFPLRGLLALGPSPARIALVDVRPGKRRERELEVPAGAAAWFCGRDRPVLVAGVLGWQPVAYELRAAGDAAWLLADWQDVECR